MSVVIVGSLGLDTIETPFGRKKDVLGGSASYASVSAGYFSPVGIVAIVGNDFPARHRNLLKKKGIDLQGLTVKKGKTFRWSGVYDWDFGDPRTLDTQLNVFSHFDPVLPPAYSRTKFLFLANIDPRIQYKVLTQVKKTKVVLCDTMNYWIEHKKKDLCRLLKHIDIFLVNESEARQLSQEGSTVKAARALLKLGPKKVIVKTGEHGAMLFSDNSVFCIPAFLLETIHDPTGAGDTFAGGFIGYLASCKTLSHSSLRKAIAFGSVMATFAVEDFSLNKLGRITAREIKKRFREFQKLTCF